MSRIQFPAERMRNAAVLLVLLATLLAAETGAAPPPTIEATPSGLRATGLTPGGEAVWFGASIGTLALTPHLKRHVAIIRDSDNDGQSLYEIPNLSRFSFIIVVDAGTGDYAAYRGDGVNAVEIDVRGNQWRSGLDHFEIPADFLEILLVRPGVGAWTTSAVDGDDQDGDRLRNNSFRLKVTDMKQIAGSGKAQGAVRRGDLVVMVDPFSLKYWIRPAKD